ncbi:hypothetical protein [Viridibacillus arvi]|uniref:hypothetical protein n=1 Tax=Viridibacillus arvi TaxID=263475 RepID=UPI0034CF460B
MPKMVIEVLNSVEIKKYKEFRDNLSTEKSLIGALYNAIGASLTLSKAKRRYIKEQRGQLIND